MVLLLFGIGTQEIILLLALGIGIYSLISFLKKKKETPTTMKKHISHICTKCKNPNTKGLQESEWCGSKID